MFWTYDFKHSKISYSNPLIFIVLTIICAFRQNFHLVWSKTGTKKWKTPVWAKNLLKQFCTFHPFSSRKLSRQISSRESFIALRNKVCSKKYLSVYVIDIRTWNFSKLHWLSIERKNKTSKKIGISKASFWNAFKQN